MPRGSLVALVLLLGAACGEDASDGEPPEDFVGIEVTSSAFDEGDTVPVEFTCDGEDVSPPLEWSGVPEGTESLRLVVEDLDAPGGSFVHWAVFGIDPSVTGVGRGEVPSGGTERPNHFGVESYRGPCPPEGDDPHRYRFTVRGFDAAGNRLAGGTLRVRYGG